MGERVVGITVLGLAQEGLLSAGEVGEETLQSFAFDFALLGRVVVGVLQFCGEDLAAVGPEDSVGEELGDGVQQG